MTILDGTSLMSALPAIERDLEPAGSVVQWAVTAYALAFSGLLLLSGKAADLLGRRKVFLLAWSATSFGLVTAAMTAASVAGALIGQRVVTRLGVRPVAASGVLLLGAACLLLARLSSGGSTAPLLVALPVFGAGMGAGPPPGDADGARVATC
ncbi:MFS transporter [Microbispora sp. NPDC088329]|uniref:MFS transporter n=1 Tax=Microbispora sp. NPDC088329 TaxID=3154869 RepID=UPI003432D1B6